jgi:hypothetical protein
MFQTRQAGNISQVEKDFFAEVRKIEHRSRFAASPKQKPTGKSVS